MSISCGTEIIIIYYNYNLGILYKIEFFFKKRYIMLINLYQQVIFNGLYGFELEDQILYITFGSLNGSF